MPGQYSGTSYHGHSLFIYVLSFVPILVLAGVAYFRINAPRLTGTAIALICPGKNIFELISITTTHT